MSLDDAKRTERKILLSIVLVALGVRLFLLFYCRAYVIDDDWAFGYETGRIAKAIVTGEGFSSPFGGSSGPTAWLMPVYPYFLALIFKIFGVYTTTSAIVTLTANCLISALTCVPVYHIARRLFGRNVGYIAAGALAFYLPSIWHAINTIWNTTVFTFLAMVLIYWLLLLPNRFDFRNAALYGFLMGFVALVNPVIVAFYPFVLIWLFLQPIDVNKRKKVLGIVVMVVLGLGTIMPWLLRNYALFGRPWLKSNFGIELSINNNPQVWKTLNGIPGGTISPANVWLLRHPSENDEEFHVYSQLGEANYIDRRFDEALTFIRENPRKFLQLTLRRVYQFWLNDLGGRQEWKGNLKISGSISRLKGLSYLLPLPFVVAGILLAIRRRIRVWPIIAFTQLLPIAYYITNVSQRYKYPIDPILLVFASYSLYCLVRNLKDKMVTEYPARS